MLLLIFILFIVFFLGVIIPFYNTSYRNNDIFDKNLIKKRSSNNSPISIDSISDSYNETLRIVNNVLFDNYSGRQNPYESEERKVSYVNNYRTRGDLYQLCPCVNEYVCDHGICKKPEGKSCVISSECATDSICYKGYCTLKPGEWEIPLNNKCMSGLNIVNNHWAILREDEFRIPKGWISFENSIGICKSNRKDRSRDELLIITKEKLYIIDGHDIETIHEEQRPFKRMSIKDRLFNHDNTIYYLRGSRLYKMVWENNHSIKWVPYKLKSDITLCDGTILIRNKNKYHVSDDILKTIIRNTIIKQSLQSVDIDINLTSNIFQIVRDPQQSEVLYCLNKNGTIYRYNYETNKVRTLKGNGRKIVVCNDAICLLTSNRCVKV